MKKVRRSKKMKIVILVVFILCIMVLASLFTISNNKKMICTMKSDQSKSGYVLETEYIVKAKGKIVRTMKITETITSSNKEKLSEFEKSFNEQYSYNQKKYGGYTYKVINKDGKVISKVTIDYKDFDMKKFIEDNIAMKKFTKNNKLTLEGAKKMYEASGAICKE